MSPGLEIENQTSTGSGMHMGIQGKEIFSTGSEVRRGPWTISPPPSAEWGMRLQGTLGSQSPIHPTARVRLRQLGTLDGRTIYDAWRRVWGRWRPSPNLKTRPHKSGVWIATG